MYLYRFQIYGFPTPPSELIPYETVVNQLSADTIQYSAGVGLNGSRFKTGMHSQAVFISLKASSFSTD